MKILLINEVCGVTSTGTICADLAEYLISRGHEVRVLYGRQDSPDRCNEYGIRIAGKMDVLMGALSSRLFDNCGLSNGSATKRAIDIIREFSPDVIHLHNLHGYFINYRMLFNEIKAMDIPVVYTLHDCWALTGHCAYFDIAGCDKWKTGCGSCPQKCKYPKSLFLDNSKRNFTEKKKACDNLPNMKVIVPSEWLKGIVKSSIFKRDAYVIANGIDTKIFCPKEGNYFEKLGLADKKVILGVASLWEARKGISFFAELAERIPKEYKIVLVGIGDGQKKDIPKSIITIPRTSDKEELAYIYSSAYVYLNPTLEENYPTTNLESICCGTPVITFASGGSPESATYYGTVCDKNIESIMDALYRVEEISQDRLEEARVFFDSSRMHAEYERMYKSCCERSD